jgi:hypothetical protein
MPTATKRKRRVYPLPFSECSKKVQDLAVQKIQDDCEESWPRWDDVQDVTDGSRA